MHSVLVPLSSSGDSPHSCHDHRLRHKDVLLSYREPLRSAVLQVKDLRQGSDSDGDVMVIILKDRTCID